MLFVVNRPFLVAAESGGGRKKPYCCVIGIPLFHNFIPIVIVSFIWIFLLPRN
jgi:hypothetical protein